MRFALPLLVALAMPAAASGAGSVANELTISSTQPTAQNPRSGTWSDRLSGTFEASDAVELHGGLNITHDNATLPRAGTTAFGQTGGNIFLFDLGLDWMPTEHLLFGGELSLSPKAIQLSATQLSATQVTIEDEVVIFEADAHLRTVSSSVGALLAAGWMSDGDKPESTAIDASVSLNHTETVQSIAAVETPGGKTVSAANLRTYCANHKEDCPAGIESVLQGRLAKINQARLGLNVSQTIRDDTDFTLGGGYYLYDRDPLEVGYFSVASVGRTFSMGEGVPIAPVRFTLRTGATHRFFHNTLSLGLWASYARYVEDEGFGASLGTRVQVRFSRSLKAWVSLTGNDDVDWRGAHSRSGSVSAGLRWSF
ncbi:MAG: hypothetical protein ACYC8T_12105 [Myxococcaceae bacterium]